MSARLVEAHKRLRAAKAIACRCGVGFQIDGCSCERAKSISAAQYEIEAAANAAIDAPPQLEWDIPETMLSAKHQSSAYKVDQGRVLVNRDALTRVIELIDPPPMKMSNGEVVAFKNPNPASVLTMISAAARDMLASAPLSSAPIAEITPRPIETAPKDGTMLILLVEFDEHSLADSGEGERVPTIGFNNYHHDGNDEWKFAGWCWSHDHFTEGKGRAVAWLPMPIFSAG